MTDGKRKGAYGRVEDVSIIRPAGNGVHIANGSSGEVRRSTIVGAGGHGIQIGGEPTGQAGKPKAGAVQTAVDIAKTVTAAAIGKAMGLGN